LDLPVSRFTAAEIYGVFWPRHISGVTWVNTTAGRLRKGDRFLPFENILFLITNSETEMITVFSGGNWLLKENKHPKILLQFYHLRQ